LWKFQRLRGGRQRDVASKFFYESLFIKARVVGVHRTALIKGLKGGGGRRVFISGENCKYMNRARIFVNGREAVMEQTDRKGTFYVVRCNDPKFAKVLPKQEAQEKFAALTREIFARGIVIEFGDPGYAAAKRAAKKKGGS
jgi:hypothetical protein